MGGYIQPTSSDITHATESHYPFRRICDDQYVYWRDVASGPIIGGVSLLHHFVPSVSLGAVDHGSCDRPLLDLANFIPCSVSSSLGSLTSGYADAGC